MVVAQTGAAMVVTDAKRCGIRAG